MQKVKLLSFIFLAALFIFSPITAKAAVIAKVIALSHNVVIERSGNQLQANIEDEIYDSDTIITDGTGKVQLMFTDHTFASLSTNTIFTMSDFNFAQDDASFTASITKGFARFVTGKIVEANPDAFKVITPEATVGIRGTTFTVESLNNYTTVSVENSIKTRSVVVNNTVVPVGFSAIFGPNGQVVTPPTRMNQGQRQSLIEKSSISFMPSGVNTDNPDRLQAYDEDTSFSKTPPFVFEDQQSVGSNPNTSTSNPNTTTPGGLAGFPAGLVVAEEAEVQLNVQYNNNGTLFNDGNLDFEVNLTTGAISGAKANITDMTGMNVSSLNDASGNISGSNFQINGSGIVNAGVDDPTGSWNANGNLNIPANQASGNLSFTGAGGAAGNVASGTITGIENVELDN